MRFGEAVAALEAAQKPSRGVSLYSSRVNRPAGRRLAAAAHVAGLSANTVTLISGLFSAFAVALLIFVRPTPLLGLAVGASLIVAFALDAADGQLARLVGGGSPRGEWLDHMVDCASKIALHAGLLIGWYRFTHRDTSLLLPIGFLLAAVMLFFGTTIVPKLKRPSTGSRAPRRNSGLMLLPVDNGIVAAAFLLAGWPDWFAAVYAALLAAHVLLLSAFCLSWWRELG